MKAQTISGYVFVASMIFAEITACSRPFGFVSPTTPAAPKATATPTVSCGPNQGNVTTLAGGTLSTSPLISSPGQMAIDANGNLYDADIALDTIQEITPAGVVSTIAGILLHPGFANGAALSSRFTNPNGVAIDRSGDIYVADTGSNLIRKISGGMVSTFAGQTNLKGFTDGATPLFNFPTAVAVDSLDNVYVADSFNHTIRKITPSGVASTFAGTIGVPGSANGTGTAASFNTPMGLVLDNESNLYVADTLNNLIRKINPGGVVTTLAGSGFPGNADGIGTAATFNSPSGLTVDPCGNVYVSDSANNQIRVITPGGQVSTLAGSSIFGETDGLGKNATFNFPFGIVINSSNILYVADSNGASIRKIQ